MSLYDNRKTGYVKVDATLVPWRGIKGRGKKKTMTTPIQPTLDPVELQNRNRQYDDYKSYNDRSSENIAKAKVKRYFPKA